MTNRIDIKSGHWNDLTMMPEGAVLDIKCQELATYLLLRKLTNVKGEVSLAFFSYNLKRVINILSVKKILGSFYTILRRLIDELNYIF